MALRSDLITKAKIAEHAQLFKSMHESMKAVVEMGGELSNDERDLLSIANKHRIGSHRLAWRVISSLEQKAEMENEDNVHIVKSYREKIEADLEGTCGEMIQLLDTYLLPTATSTDAQVYYNKMKADYYRYMAEIVSVPEKRKKIVSTCNKAYNTAFNLASESMPPVHPIRLGVAINYAVFLYEIKNSDRKAINVAKISFDAALEKVEMLQKSEYKDSALIMQLIRDNLNLWNTTRNLNTVDPE